MGPVLDESSRRLVPQRIERRHGIRAEAGEEGQVVRADEDVDAIDLHGPEPAHDRKQLAARNGPLAIAVPVAETLCYQGDSAGLGTSEAPHPGALTRVTHRA